MNDRITHSVIVSAGARPIKWARRLLATTPRTSIAMVVLMLGSFFAYAFFPWATMRGAEPRFNSPDETVNYVFAKRVASGAGIGIEESLNTIAANIVRPRSTTVVGDRVVPASFLGLPVLYGGIGLVTGIPVLPYLTPFFTALAVGAAYGMWRRLFDRRTALVAAALLAAHPALWYFASRSFYHNILFLDALVVAVWAYLVARERGFSLDWLLVALLALIVALFVRTSEALWLGVVVVVVTWRQTRLWPRSHFVVFVSLCAALASIGALFFTSVYGLPVPSGYQLVSSSGSAGGGLPGAVAWRVLFPFGLHFSEVIWNVARNALALFPLHWLLVTLGFLQLVQRRADEQLPHIRNYVWIAAAVSAWLLLYYGNAVLTDTVGPNVLTTGSSYVRYWLPIYVVWLPFAALGLRSITQRLSRESLWLGCALLLISAASFWQVYFSSPEGLVHVAARLSAYREVNRAVQALTGNQAVIVGDRSDKIFFPERRVVTPGDRPFVTYPEVVEGLAALADVVPVYVYSHTVIGDDVRAALTSYRFVLQRPRALPHGGWLYPLTHL